MIKLSKNIYLSYVQWYYRYFHMLHQRLTIYFRKAEYITQVMTRTVKNKWGVGSTLNLSPIKAQIQYQRKPQNIYWKRIDIHIHTKLRCRHYNYNLRWNGGFCFKFTNYKSRSKYRTHGLFCGNTSKVPLLFQDA